MVLESDASLCQTQWLLCHLCRASIGIQRQVGQVMVQHFGDNSISLEFQAFYSFCIFSVHSLYFKRTSCYSLGVLVELLIIGVTKTIHSVFMS